MLLKYTDNYGKPKILEIPDDTSEEVLKFLEENERRQEAVRKTDSNHREKSELSDEQLFKRAVHKSHTIAEMIENTKERPERLILNFIKNNCTEKQRRRFYLYVLYDIPIKTIAYWESCTVESIDESILAVLKKIKFSTLPD